MIDSHAHLGFDSFGDDRAEVLTRLKEAGVRWLEVGTDVASSESSLALANANPNSIIGATVGVHPSDIAELTEENWQRLEEMLADPKAVAVGEVGLDYHHQTNVTEQLTVLDRFLRLAVAKNLPVVFHVRDGNGMSAHTDLLTALAKRSSEQRPRGVIHTFSGNFEQAQEYLKLGLYLSFSGVVTYKKAGPIAEAAAAIPLNRLLIETDSPFLTPEPHRSERNDPSFVRLVAEKIAELRQDDVEEVIAASEVNAKDLFGVK